MHSYFVAAPLRRVWSVEKYLSSLLAMDYDFSSLSFYFLLNNIDPAERDDFIYCFVDLAEKFRRKGAKFSWDEEDVPDLPIDKRDPRIREAKIYGRLADLRNSIVDKFLASEKQYLLSIDSDIYVDPKILNSFDRYPEFSVLSAWISNDVNMKNNASQFGNCMLVDPKSVARNTGPMCIHLGNIPVSEVPFEVDITGACIRISREVFTGVVPRYAWHRQGEDIPFCLALKMKGFNLFSIKNNLAFHDIQSGNSYLT